MRYSDSTKKEVRRLRSLGLSLNQIKEKMDIPRTTIRLWIKDIALTNKQKARLEKRIQKALQSGRKKAQKLFKKERINEEKKLLIEGRKEIGKLTRKELFVAGISLYWGEGFKNKHERRLGFCNSDPRMIRFYLHWLEKCLGVKKNQIILRLSLNSAFKSKTKEIEEYWSNETNIPKSQFTKPFYQNSIWKKHFETDSYKGILRIHVKDSLESLLKMRGWLVGLQNNMPG